MGRFCYTGGMRDILPLLSSTTSSFSLSREKGHLWHVWSCSVFVKCQSTTYPFLCNFALMVADTMTGWAEEMGHSGVGKYFVSCPLVSDVRQQSIFTFWRRISSVYKVVYSYTALSKHISSASFRPATKRRCLAMCVHERIRNWGFTCSDLKSVQDWKSGMLI